MAQIIKHRRGTLAELGAITLANGEIGIVTGSAVIGDAALRTAVVVGNTDGTHRLSIGRIITGNATPNLTSHTGGAAFNNMLYHETDAKTLLVLNTGGNTNLDLTGNIADREVGGTLDVTGRVDAQAGLQVTGSLNVSGDGTFGGNLTFGDADTDLVSFGADIGSNLIPNADDTYDLGSATQAWQDLFLEGDITLTDAGKLVSSAGNLTVDSEAGSLVLDGHTGVDIDASNSGKVAIDGAGGIDIGVAADVAIDVDASTFDLDASGAVTIDGATGSHFKAAGTLALSGSAVTIAGGGGSEIDITTTGGAIDVNSATLDVDTTSTVAIDAVGVSIDSSAASNLTTSAGALTLTSAAAATWSTSAGALIIDGAGGLTLDSDGTDAVNLGTEAVAKTITIGNAASTMVDINALALDFDSAAATDILAATTVSVKGATGASFGDDTGTWEFDGSGAVSETGMTTFSLTPSSTMDIDAGGAVTIDGTSVTIGADDSGVAISIGHTTSETTVNDNLTVTGNLTVNGTQTTVSSSVLDIGDNIIQVNGTPVTYGGLHVKDVTAGQTGSMVWNSTSDYWVAGLSGSEYRVPIQNTTTALTDNRVVLAQGNGRIESSANITDDGSTVDFNDVDLTSLDKLEGVDDNTYIDLGGSTLIVTKGTLQPSAHNGNDLGATGTRYKDLWLQGNADLEGDIDVNGTANLDNTDIDGTLDVSGVSDFQSRVDAQASLAVTGSVYVSAGASVAAASASLVSFRNDSSTQLGYLASADTQAVTTGLVGYNTSTGNLTISSVIDGGSF